MTPFKELYRQFGLQKFVFAFEAGNPAQSAEAAKEQPKEQKKPEATQDMGAAITGHQEAANRWIEHLQRMYQTGPNKNAAELLASKLQQHATAEFTRIHKQYADRRTELGEGWERSNEAKNKEQEAINLLNTIYKRVEASPAYVEFQTYIEQMTPESRQKLVAEYLRQNKDTKDMSEQARVNLARLMVEANVVDFKDANLRNYSGNLDAYFNTVNQSYLSRHMAERLGGENEETLVNKVVEKFLQEAPNPEATDNERNWFKKLIKDNKDLTNRYGTSQESGSPTAKVADILAKRFDIRFEGGKIAYVIDLGSEQTPDNRAVAATVLNEKQFTELVTNELNTRDLFEQATLERYARGVERNTEWYKEAREEIADIDKWEDWADHQEATDMMRISAPLRLQAEKVRGEQQSQAQTESAQKQKEADAKATQARIETYNNAIPVLNAAISKAKAGSFVETDTQDEKPDFSQPTYEVTETLQNQKTNDVIRLSLNEKGEITVTITHEPKQGHQYKIEDRYTAEQFKNIDLAQMAADASKNELINSESVTAIRNEIDSVNKSIKGLSVDFKETSNYSEMASKNFRLPTAPINVGNMQVGNITFDTLAVEQIEGTQLNKVIKATIQMGEKPLEVTLDKLKATLSARVPEAKKIAETATNNQKEIKEQADKDLPNLAKIDGLTPNPEKELNGNFSNPKDKIKVATLNKTKNGEAAATLSIAVAKEKDKPRAYVLTVNGKDVVTGTLTEVNQYLEANKTELIRVPAPEPEKEKAKPGREATIKNLEAIARKNWPDLMAGIKEGDVRLANALTSFANNLTEARAKELEKPEAQLTPQEKGDLQKAFTEAFAYGNMEKVDENEVKAINALQVTIGGNTTTFEQVFGPGLARTMSMKGEIQPGTTSSTVKIRVGNEYKQAEARALADLIPEAMVPQYLKILDGQARPEELTAFRQEASKEAKCQENMQTLTQVMNSPQGRKAFENMGIGQIIATFAKLFKMFQEAMKTGDFKSLEDGIKDFQEGKDPSERMQNALDTYTSTVDKINSTGDLLALYVDPYGDKAKQLFDQPGKSVPYRVQLKQVVQARIGKAIGVEIRDMEVKTKDNIVVKAVKGSEDYKIYFERRGSQSFVAMDKIDFSEGSEKLTPVIAAPGKEVKDLTTGDKNLNHVLFVEPKPTPAPPPAPAAETPAAPAAQEKKPAAPPAKNKGPTPTPPTKK